MKNYSYLIACVFFAQALSAQTLSQDASDPVIQLKQSLQLHKVGPPALKKVAMVSMPSKATVKPMDIVKSMKATKLLCPLLKFKPEVELEGQRQTNEDVGLKWKTTNGFDNRAFDVERSLGDTTHFEKVNFVWADDGSGLKANYSLPDKNNFDEISYYRLRLIMNDGQSIYSNIARVKGYSDNSFEVYPNPAPTKVGVSFASKVQGNATLTIYDANGRAVQYQNLVLNNGYNHSEFDVANLPGALYTIRLQLPDKQIRIGKFLKE